VRSHCHGAHCVHLCSTEKLDPCAGKAQLDLLQTPGNGGLLQHTATTGQEDIPAETVTQPLGEDCSLGRLEDPVVEDCRARLRELYVICHFDHLTGQGIAHCARNICEAQLENPTGFVPTNLTDPPGPIQHPRLEGLPNCAHLQTKPLRALHWLPLLQLRICRMLACALLTASTAVSGSSPIPLPTRGFGLRLLLVLILMHLLVLFSGTRHWAMILVEGLD
jgi:hypothetical protein